MPTFTESYDTLLAEILAVFVGLFPDEPAGANDPMLRFIIGLTFIRWACRQDMDFSIDQFFLDTAQQRGVERQANQNGVQQLPGENFEDFKRRTQDIFADRKGGGRPADYKQVAEGVSGVKSAKIIGQETEGAGQVGVTLLSELPSGTVDAVAANKLKDSVLSQFVADMFDVTVPRFVKNTTTGAYSKITGFTGIGELDLEDDIFLNVGEGYTVHYRKPTQSVIDLVETAVEDFRPETDTPNVRASSISSVENIVMTASGENVDINTIISDVEIYVNNLDTGGRLEINQLVTQAVLNGATSINVISPPSDVSSSVDGHILLGSVAIT